MKKKHRPNSLRLQGYDYRSLGAYFVTICTHERKHIFSKIQNGVSILDRPGLIVEESLLALPDHYPFIEIDEYIIMPNHVHAILFMVDLPVGAGLKPALRSEEAGLKPAPTPKHGLSEIVRAWKTFSARHIHDAGLLLGRTIWQRNYHDHIIRNESSLTTIQTYILGNPLKWQTDEYFSDHVV